jgi:hypothetical protein
VFANGRVALNGYDICFSVWIEAALLFKGAYDRSDLILCRFRHLR